MIDQLTDAVRTVTKLARELEAIPAAELSHDQRRAYGFLLSARILMINARDQLIKQRSAERGERF